MDANWYYPERVPLHIRNCRCVLIPIVENVALPDFIEEFLNKVLEDKDNKNHPLE